MKGKLILVPTPIGNLGDITLRAIDCLRNADYIYAEDTRKTGILLKHLLLDKRSSSYHNFNEHQIVQHIVKQINDGLTIVLVSDAGTPAISDPGFLLVRECLAANLNVECLPGATAFVPALVKSGLPSDRFAFEGFLPVKKGRHTRLQNLIYESRTMIFYESPHRILKTLQEFKTLFGAERLCSVSRELTKIYEQTINGTLDEVYNALQVGVVKGEFVLVVAGLNASKNKVEDDDESLL